MAAELVSVVGPIAAGKTTLAERLARDLPAALLREDYAGNPFIAAAAADGARWSLPSQLYFLLSRVRQLGREFLPDTGVVVADYGFCQDRIYAEIHLDGADLSAYRHIHDTVEKLVCPPAVVVHVDADPAVLMDRIRARGRHFETGIEVDFVKELRSRHDDPPLPPGCRLLRYDGGDTDGGAYARLLDEIRSIL